MPLKILIIDDNKETIMTLDYALRREGYDIETAYDGQEGYTKALEFHPDIIILDIMMPVMDGYTMNRHLKENPDTEDIPVIIITAKNDSGLKFGKEGLNRVEAIMKKPFQYQFLLAKIKEILLNK